MEVRSQESEDRMARAQAFSKRLASSSEAARRSTFRNENKILVTLRISA
jgi:hypothetical protein